MSATRQQKDRLEDYITVAERIEKFYQKYPGGRIITHIVEHDSERGFILMRAEGYRAPDDAQPAATGHAFELQSEGYVNRNSYIENGESSAVGRMLAMLGFEVKRGIASREEMQKAHRLESVPPSRDYPAPLKPADGGVGPTEFWAEANRRQVAQKDAAAIVAKHDQDWGKSLAEVRAMPIPGEVTAKDVGF